MEDVYFNPSSPSGSNLSDSSLPGAGGACSPVYDPPLENAVFEHCKNLCFPLEFTLKQRVQRWASTGGLRNQVTNCEAHRADPPVVCFEAHRRTHRFFIQPKLSLDMLGSANLGWV